MSDLPKEKLVLPIIKPLTPKEGNSIRATIDDETLKTINALSKKTGIHTNQIARLCIEFTLPRIEISDINAE